ncbi:MAG: hypothetical protein VYA54_06715 [Bdellovibrionota bacterium]|nr:hypothetical protein [Bdellovibrionota bacterium]
MKRALLIYLFSLSAFAQITVISSNDNIPYLEIISNEQDECLWGTQDKISSLESKGKTVLDKTSCTSSKETKKFHSKIYFI